MVWECSIYNNRRGAHRVVLGIPEGKRLLERPRCRWKENITINLK